MSVINTELDILKKNILELVEVSKNVNPISESICSACTLKNPIGTKNCEACGTLLPEKLKITYSKTCSECTLINPIINSICSACDGTKFKITNYDLEYERIKCIINYYMKLPITFNPIQIIPSFTGTKKSSVIIMRHGIRADNCQIIKKVTKLNKWGKMTEQDEKINKISWPDMESSPYDPPLLDYDLPLIRAKEFANEYNITKIVSSPFRRCLQTAAIIAKHFRIPEIEINEKFGEERAAFSRYNIPIYTITDNIIKEALGDIQLIKKDGQSIRTIAENYNSNKDQFLEGLQEYRTHKNLLIVSHGDIFDIITNYYINNGGMSIRKYPRQEIFDGKHFIKDTEGKDVWPRIITASPVECAYTEFDIDTRTILKSKGITYE
jgi:hypothetical protein